MSQAGSLRLGDESPTGALCLSSCRNASSKAEGGLGEAGRGCGSG